MSCLHHYNNQCPAQPVYLQWFVLYRDGWGLGKEKGCGFNVVMVTSHHHFEPPQPTSH